MEKKTVKDINLNGKRVFMRADFNVPLDQNLNITDDTRIKAALPTINYILKNNGKLILSSHLGRPKGPADSLRLTPVANRLSKLLNKPVKKLDDCIGDSVKKEVSQMKPGDVLLLENVRFYAEEEKNDANFAKKLAELADIYVNDAFGTCHRAHASTEGIAKFLPAVAGFLVEKEIAYFEKALKNPDKPFVLILGGAKVSDKIGVIENMLDKVNAILIGGGMAYTFLKAKGVNIGSSKLEKDKIDIAKDILSKAEAKKVKIILPIDHLNVLEINENAKTSISKISIPDGFIAVDIGPETISLFKNELKSAKTIVWNGPVGIFEMKPFSKGTEELAKFVADLKAIKIIGGGDTVAAVEEYNVADKMSHVSTGGGASLEYLEGKVLPGIAALNNK